MSLTLLAAAREHSPARPRIRWEENPTIRPVSARARRLNPGAVRVGERDHGRMESKAARDLAERLDVTGWPARLGADDGGIAAVAGSMDRDGLVREAAV